MDHLDEPLRMNVQQYQAKGGAITEDTIASSMGDIKNGEIKITLQVDFNPHRDTQYILRIGIGTLSNCHVTIEGSEQITEHTTIRNEGGGNRTYPGIVYELNDGPHQIPKRIEGNQQLTIDRLTDDPEYDWRFIIGDGLTKGGVAKISETQYHKMANLFGSLSNGYPFDSMKGTF